MLRRSASRFAVTRPITCPFGIDKASKSRYTDDLVARSVRTARSRSPTSLVSHMHGKLVDAVREKAHVQESLNDLKLSMEQFSVRLDFILKCTILPTSCLLDVRDFNDDLSAFVQHHCLDRTSPGPDPATDQSFCRMRDALTESEIACARLKKQNDSLQSSISLMRLSSVRSQTPNRFRTASAEEAEGEARRMRSRIDTMKTEICEKQTMIDEMRQNHEAQLKRLEEVNREEVDTLRDALTSTSKSLDKWKNIYADDIARLRDEMDEKTVRRSESANRLSTVQRTR